jgi:hypothetical protein
MRTRMRKDSRISPSLPYHQSEQLMITLSPNLLNLLAEEVLGWPRSLKYEAWVLDFVMLVLSGLISRLQKKYQRQIDPVIVLESDCISPKRGVGDVELRKPCRRRAGGRGADSH